MKTFGQELRKIREREELTMKEMAVRRIFY